LEIFSGQIYQMDYCLENQIERSFARHDASLFEKGQVTSRLQEQLKKVHRALARNNIDLKTLNSHQLDGITALFCAEDVSSLGPIHFFGPTTKDYREGYADGWDRFSPAVQNVLLGCNVKLKGGETAIAIEFHDRWFWSSKEIVRKQSRAFYNNVKIDVCVPEFWVNPKQSRDPCLSKRPSLKTIVSGAYCRGDFSSFMCGTCHECFHAIDYIPQAFNLPNFSFSFAFANASKTDLNNLGIEAARKDFGYYVNKNGTVRLTELFAETGAELVGGNESPMRCYWPETHAFVLTLYKKFEDACKESAETNSLSPIADLAGNLPRKILRPNFPLPRWYAL
jgi:hypothetical protein